jgi:hypothetical protein
MRATGEERARGGDTTATPAQAIRGASSGASRGYSGLRTNWLRLARARIVSQHLAMRSCAQSLRRSPRMCAPSIAHMESTTDAAWEVPRIDAASNPRQPSGMAGLGLGEILFAPVLSADALDEMVWHYSVHAGDRYAGVLDSWEREESGRPIALIAARGWFGRERCKIPVAKLLEVDHDQRRLRVDRSSVPPTPPKRLDRLLQIIRRRAEDRVEHVPDGSVLCALTGQDTRVMAVARELAAALEIPLVLAHLPPVEASVPVSGCNGTTRQPQPRTQPDVDLFIDELASRSRVGMVKTRSMTSTSFEELARHERARFVVVASHDDIPASMRDFTHGGGIARLSCPVVLVPRQARRV